MLAMDFIKANPDIVRKAMDAKGVDIDLDHFLRLEEEVRNAKTEIEALRAERNKISGMFKDAAPEEKADLGKRAKEAGKKAGELEAALADKQAELKAITLQMPGIPWDGAPVGPDESFNTVIRTEGEKPQFDFVSLVHCELMERNV